MPQQQRPTTADVLGSVPRWVVATPSEAAAPPLAGIASLRLHIVGAGGTVVFFLGTGWFLSPTTVVTAAHVTDVSAAWSKVVAPVSWHIEILPGRAAQQNPFGTYWAGQVIRHPRWTGRHPDDNDIAILKTAEGPPFPQQHCLRAAADVITASSLPAVTVAGYPHTVDSGGTPVRSSGPVRVVEGALCFYDIDTEDGQSGAPVLLAANGTASVAAIHAGGQGSGTTSLANGLNAGLRLRRELVDWLDAQ